MKSNANYLTACIYISLCLIAISPQRIFAEPEAGIAKEEVAIVANSIAGKVSFISIDTSQVIKTINAVPDGKHLKFFVNPIRFVAQIVIELIEGVNYVQDTDVSPDGTTLYISRGYRGDVVAIDIATGKIIWKTFISGFRADHMDISKNGNDLFVSATLFGGNITQVLSSNSGAINKLREIKTGIWPHDVHALNDKVYVSSMGALLLPELLRGRSSNAYLMTVADPADGSIINTIPFEKGIRPFVIDDKETFTIAQLSNRHGLVKRSLIDGSLIDHIDLPIDENSTQADYQSDAPHHGLAMAPNEEYLCVAGRASDYAAIIDTQELSKFTTIDVGDGPSWAAITSDNKYCLTANTYSNDVSIISIDDLEELGSVSVDEGPKHITIAYIPSSILFSQPQ